MFRELIYIKCAQCSAELLEFPGSDKLEGVRVTRENGAPGVLLFENHSDAIKVALSRDWSLGDVDLCLRCSEARIEAVVIRGRKPVFTAKSQDKNSGVAAFIGTWPGDETDDELLAALESSAVAASEVEVELAPVDERDDPDAGISIGKGERVISGHNRQDGKTLIMLEDHGLEWIPEIEIHGDSEVYMPRFDPQRGVSGDVIVSKRYATARGWL